MDSNYSAYLDRAAAVFAGHGAQVLLAPHVGNAAPWTQGWDQILLMQGGGASTLYAFADGTGTSRENLQARINDLATGLAAQQLLGQVTLHLISIISVCEQADAALLRRYADLTPSTFYQGLRPQSVALDLSSGRIDTGKLWTTETGRLLKATLSTGEGAPLDRTHVAQLHARNEARVTAFYDLMRGRMPLITYLLIAVNVGIFGLLYVNGNPDSAATLQRFGALSPHLVEQGQWWRIVASMFLHASIPHILFNMTSLFAIGTLAERLYGSWKFLAIYLGAGLAGSLVSLGHSVVTGNLDVLGVGASGAIFGVAGALLTVRFQASDVIPQRLRDRVSTSLLPLVLISLVFSFLTPYVDNSAHIGGLIAGAALSFVFPLVKQMPGSVPVGQAGWGQ